MKNGNLLIALIVGGLIGFVVGKTTTPSATAETGKAGSMAEVAKADPSKPAAPRPPPPADKTVYKIPLGNAPQQGPATAKVTIVEYSDFQCPFCSRVVPTVKQIEDKYGSDVRILFKQNPLPFHPFAPLAAEASLAANEQGKFWQMHDKLFANQANLGRPDLEKYAQDLGLDMDKFKAALDSGKFKPQIEADKAEAANFQANGTPHFFVNGRRLSGAQPFDSFKALIDAELVKANELSAKGVAGPRLYEELTKSGLTKASTPPPPPSPVQPIHEKDLAGAAMIGAAKAKVTIVEWSDFQCPYCSRAAPTIEKIVKDYPDSVRLYFKHQPLPFHPNAKPAALASVAAQNQGKFWEFHDKAFGAQKDLAPEKYEQWAGEIGLNASKFKADIASPKTQERVDADSAQGAKFGANGTPTFFIDGRQFAGALPYEQFKAAVDEELKKADEMLKKGVKQSDLYDKLVDANVASAPRAPAPSAAAAPAAEEKPVNIALGNAPVTGNPNAKVTIVEFSDFQCPYCSRGKTTIDAILEKYKGKVKVAFKNQPLPFHPNAKPAAKAALAAGDQGKYWQMYDLLFAHQAELSPDKYEEWAKQLGLDVGKFKDAMASSKYDQVIEADSTLGTSVGANGTPTFFINGRKLVGAQPQEAFEKIIDEELKK
jgi:protein-disulfide isomerase